MSASPFFVSKFVVRNLKQIAVQSLPQISSSHVSEGIAAALGFKSYAALRSALSEHATALAQRPSNASMVHRLKQLGHVDLPDNLKVLLDLDRSYSPFKTYSLRRKKGIRWTAWRNVVVSAINAGLEQRVFGLLPGENWWPGAPRGAEVGLHTTFPFVFDRNVPGAVSVKGSSGDTLFINVVLNPPDRQWQFGPRRGSSRGGRPCSLLARATIGSLDSRWGRWFFLPPRPLG